jgi:hypothetical protein
MSSFSQGRPRKARGARAAATLVRKGRPGRRRWQAEAIMAAAPCRSSPASRNGRISWGAPHQQAERTTVFARFAPREKSLGDQRARRWARPCGPSTRRSPSWPGPERRYGRNPRDLADPGVVDGSDVERSPRCTDSISAQFSLSPRTRSRRRQVALAVVEGDPPASPSVWRLAFRAAGEPTLGVEVFQMQAGVWGDVEQRCVSVARDELGSPIGGSRLVVSTGSRHSRAGRRRPPWGGSEIVRGLHACRRASPSRIRSRPHWNSSPKS